MNMKFKHGYTLEQIIEAGNERKAKFMFDKYKPDFKGEVQYFKDVEGARETPATSGYRPAHQVTDDMLTSGEHIYYENDAVFPGETVKAYIKLLAPEEYPHCLFVGKKININEGARVVGIVTVLEIYNPLLNKNNE